MTNKVLFHKRYFFNGLLYFILIGLFVYIILNFALNNQLLILFITIFLVFILFLKFNKKWIFDITIEREIGVTFNYPLNIIGVRTELIHFPDIEKAVYHGYQSLSPSYCELLSNKGSFSFNFSEEDMEILFEFFKTQNIDVTYNDKKDVGYRK